MIWLNCRKQFERWTLKEKKTFFWIKMIYEIQWLIKIERYFKYTEDRELHDLLWYIFWEYEYHWQQMTARQISYILWVDHTTVDRALERIKYQIRQWHLLL